MTSLVDPFGWIAATWHATDVDGGHAIGAYLLVALVVAVHLVVELAALAAVVTAVGYLALMLLGAVAVAFGWERPETPKAPASEDTGA